MMKSKIIYENYIKILFIHFVVVDSKQDISIIKNVQIGMLIQCFLGCNNGSQVYMLPWTPCNQKNPSYGWPLFYISVQAESGYLENSQNSHISTSCEHFH